MPRSCGGEACWPVHRARCPCLQVEVLGRSGEKTPVSVWMKRMRQEQSPCCVVVLEPVDRVSAQVTFGSDVSLCSNSRRVTTRPLPRALRTPFCVGL